MISVNDYLKNPCGTLSIPYWKAKTISIPENMRIVHDRDFSEDYLEKYVDEKYFRLCHTLEKVDKINLTNFNIITVNPNNIDAIVSIINQSYSDIQVSNQQIKGYKKTIVYNANLWILVREKSTGKYVGSGIADYDDRIKELVLEWIQVLPEYRERRIGQAIVNELLHRMQGVADFATVSGKIDNITNPEVLYRRCGFIGNDVWHVLRAK